MEKISIDTRYMDNGPGTIHELPANVNIVIHVAGKEFTVKINPDKTGLVVREVSGETISLKPNGFNGVQIL